jgi:hypothetical protein
MSTSSAQATLEQGGHTAHALSIDNGRVTEDHVASALLVQFGNGCSDSLQSEYSTVGKSGDGTLSQVLDNVGNGVGLGSEEVVDFLKNANCQSPSEKQNGWTYFLDVAPTLSPWKFRNPPRACKVGHDRFSVYSPCVFGHAARTGARSFRDGAAETDCQC